MNDHIVRSFDEALKKLTDMLLRMGGMVENELAMATQAMESRDADMAAQAVAEDRKVDALENEIEQYVIQMLALRQPMAADLRLVVAALKITGDLERIGDYAANVAKRGIVLTRFPGLPAMGGLTHMAALVQEQVREIVDALDSSDAAKAAEVWRSDRAVDDLYNTIFRELITYMMEDPRNITPCTHLLFIAKNLERIGDHATNIAETVHYAVTGEALPGARPKGDDSAYVAVSPKISGSPKE